MARDDAYQRAERTIEEARRTSKKTLDLSGEWEEKSPKLTELPESIGQLKQLLSLNLSNNQLTALPESLGELTQLRSLDLSENQINTLPKSFERLQHLEYVILGDNPLGELPTGLRTLPRLRDLRVMCLRSKS